MVNDVGGVDVVVDTHVIVSKPNGTRDILLSPGQQHLNGAAAAVYGPDIYAVAGTWLTDRIGRPLVRLNFNQQRFEADFRFGLVNDGKALFNDRMSAARAAGGARSWLH